MAIADITVIGLDRGENVVTATEYLAEMHKRLNAQQRVEVKLDGMGTEIEGDVADVLAVAAEMHELPFEMGAKDVYTIIKLHDPRRGGDTVTSDSKIEEVRSAMRG